uniref:RNA polymerase sigma-70 domain-containing protein n=1 Tax=Lotharella globosa TaxID=91324 RepID=A0A7S4DYW4_9EUKA
MKNYSKIIKINNLSNLIINKNKYLVNSEKKKDNKSLFNKKIKEKKNFTDSAIDNRIITHVRNLSNNQNIQVIPSITFESNSDLLLSKIIFKNETILMSWIKSLLKLEKIFFEVEKKLGFFPSLNFMAKYCNFKQKKLKNMIVIGKYSKKILIKKSLKLIISISKKYSDKGLAFEDLIAEGILGFMKGIKKFDFTKGHKFTTYAHWWIRQSISRAIDDQSRIIRIPVYVKEILNKITKIKMTYYEKFNKYPNVKELSLISGIDENQIQKLLLSCNDVISLDATLDSNDEGDPLRDSVEDLSTISSFKYATEKNLKTDMEKAIMALSDRESAVIRLRYGLDDGKERTLEEIGEFLNVTRERARQIEIKALNKLRKENLLDIFNDYL